MVGNAWTYSVFDNRGAVDYWYTHALISNETYQGIINNCDFGKIGPLKGDPQDQCDMFVDSAFSEMGNINIYDIYVDVCLSRRQQKYVEQLGRAGSRLHRALASVKINPPYQVNENTIWFFFLLIYFIVSLVLMSILIFI